MRGESQGVKAAAMWMDFFPISPNFADLRVIP